MADRDSGVTPTPRYSAFISYNHCDRAEAVRLQRDLESYRIPTRLRGHSSPLGPLGARLPKLFRDRDELATSPDLAASVRLALAHSHALIVICSPNGARSRWVNEEIRTFKALGRGDRIFCHIVAGEPHAASMPGGDPEAECFPPALFEGQDVEPLATDIRPGQDSRRAARLKLVAGLIGVDYDELRQREQARRTRSLAIASAAMGVGLFLMTGLALLALYSRNEAVKERDLARRKTITAERTVDFVESLFEVSDPSQARGATITAREILDRGARQIHSQLGAEPSVKAELSTTLGEVYGDLGLFREGESLIREGLQLRPVDYSTRARQLAALGDAQARQGDYGPAVQSYREALRDDTRGGEPSPNGGEPSSKMTSRILEGMGEALSALNQEAVSQKVLMLAARLDRERGKEGLTDLARDLEALAVNDIDGKRFDEANQRASTALNIRLKAQGSLHPKVGEDLNTLGAIAYFRQQPTEAEAYYRRSLAHALIVIGPNHPDTATIMNNLARLMVERQDFRDATPILERSVSIIVHQRNESYDDLAFSFDNLGLAKRGLGEDAAAEALFRKALAAARLHNHRNVAPILVDLADLVCSEGRAREGLSYLDEAAPIMARAYSDDPWRFAWLETVRGGCLMVMGDRVGALRQLELGAPAVRARWSRTSLYGTRAAALLQEARRADV